MRVLFTSVAAWGHVHPMVPLARAFIARGDEVLWATAPDASARLERDGIPTTPAGLTEAEMGPRFSEVFDTVAHLPPQERPRHVFGKIFGRVSASASFAAIDAAVRDWQPDVLICEQGEFAGPLAAALAGVPNICHAFGPRLPADRVSRVEAEVEPLWAANGLDVPRFAGCYSHLYLDIYPPSLAAGPSAIACDIQLLRPVGFATVGEAVPDFVAADDPRPLVYLTLGTVFNSLRALSDAVQAVGGLPVRVVVTVGPNGDPAALGDQPDNVYVARYISQSDLLPYCSAVVSHAGSGTFLAALAAGLSQVCLPQGADQFLNAAAGQASGAAISLRPDEAGVDSIREAVDRALHDESVHAAARTAAREIAAMPGPDDVAELLAARFA